MSLCQKLDLQYLFLVFFSFLKRIPIHYPRISRLSKSNILCVIPLFNYLSINRISQRGGEGSTIFKLQKANKRKSRGNTQRAEAKAVQKAYLYLERLQFVIKNRSFLEKKTSVARHIAREPSRIFLSPWCVKRNKCHA